MTKDWAVITGATSGIGLECARELAHRGYNLVLAARSQPTLQKLEVEFKAKGVDVLTVTVDLSDGNGPKNLVQATDNKGIIPKLLINNAGVGVFGKFLDMPLEESLKMLELNVASLVSLTHMYGTRMKKQGGGHILQVASTGAFQPLPSYGLYAATKSLVLSFSYTFNFEHMNDKVTSTALCPGPTQTSFFSKSKFAPSKALEGMMMKPDVVAKCGIDGMLKGKDVVIPGLVNLAGSLFGRFVPKRLLMSSMAPLFK